jgi:hypothetical protein
VYDEIFNDELEHADDELADAGPVVACRAGG